MSEDLNHAAVINAPGSRIQISIRPISRPGPDELLVRNYAIAVNPVDWKLQDGLPFFNTFPTVLGSDGCGIVKAVGSAVTRYKVGDRVTGFAGVIYNQNPDHGAWQTYTLLREVVTTKIPSTMSFEEGSVFPMAFATAACALFVNLGIPRPPATFECTNSVLLVWGAASSIGSACLQIAKALGITVYATASPQHHGWLKELGASEVLDYRDPDVVKKLIAVAKTSGKAINLAFDSITEGNTCKLTSDILVASGGAGSKLVLALPWPEKDEKPRGIEISQAGAYTLSTSHVDVGSWFFNEWLQEALAEGTIVPAPKVEIVPGGLEGTQTAFDLSKAGVSGKKLVVQVGTPV